MKKKVVILLMVSAAILAMGFIFYQKFLPEWVAKTIVTDDPPPPYLPKRILNVLEPFQKHVIKGTEDVIATLHDHQIPLEEVLDMIDRTSEATFYSFVDSLNLTKPSNPDKAFNIAKHYFRPSFDPEIFRDDFNKNVNQSLLKRGLRLMELNRKASEIDFETGKAIVKKVLVQKEKRMIADAKNLEKENPL